MREDVYNDPDVINAQFGNAALEQQVQLVPQGGVTLAGLTLTTPLAVTSGGTGANSATGARSNLGLGGLAVLNAGAAVANSGVVAGGAYVQADFQAVIDKLNELLGSLRTAGVIAP